MFLSCQQLGSLLLTLLTALVLFPCSLMGVLGAALAAFASCLLLEHSLCWILLAWKSLPGGDFYGACASAPLRPLHYLPIWIQLGGCLSEGAHQVFGMWRWPFLPLFFV